MDTIFAPATVRGKSGVAVVRVSGPLVNNVNNPNALAGATGNGTVYAENCKSWADVFHDDIFSMDIKLTYSPWSDIKFYFDILNITEDVDVFYYRGNEHSGGNVLFFTEGIGRTYQLGVNVSFW